MVGTLCKVVFSSEEGLAFLKWKGGLGKKTCIKLQIATVVTWFQLVTQEQQVLSSYRRLRIVSVFIALNASK